VGEEICEGPISLQGERLGGEVNWIGGIGSGGLYSNLFCDRGVTSGG